MKRTKIQLPSILLRRLLEVFPELEMQQASSSKLLMQASDPSTIFLVLQLLWIEGD